MSLENQIEELKRKHAGHADDVAGLEAELERQLATEVKSEAMPLEGQTAYSTLSDRSLSAFPNRKPRLSIARMSALEYSSLENNALARGRVV